LFTTLKTRLVPVVVTTGVAAALALGGATSAAAGTGATEPQQVTSVVTGSGGPTIGVADLDVTAAGSVCRTHNPPGAGSATACRTWNPMGGGYYYGTWGWTGTSGVTVQGRFDGNVLNLAHNGSYEGTKQFLTRGCKSGQCTAWS